MTKNEAIEYSNKIKECAKKIPGVWIREIKEEKPELRIITLEISIKVD